MKSALEIAMEKVSGMPRLTEEEVQLQKEREFLPRGVAIANRYLQGDLGEKDLQLEICRFQGREAEIVQKACLLTLCQAIKLEDNATSLRAVEGIQAARSNAGLVEIRQEIEAIFNEFNQQLDQKRDQFEMTEKEKLRQLGISGSAVKSSSFPSFTSRLFTKG